MRWVAGAVMLIATRSASAVLNVPLPTAALIILSLVVLAYNAAIWAITRRAGEMWLHSIATAQVAFDWLALALFVHFTGGIESPAIAFFLFHLVMAALLLEERISNIYAAFVIGVVAAIAALEAIGGCRTTPSSPRCRLSCIAIRSISPPFLSSSASPWAW